jgi:antitoxin MazE
LSDGAKYHLIEFRFPTDQGNQMSRAVIGKWGGGLGLRLPSEIVRSLDLTAGSNVDVALSNHDIVITPLAEQTTIQNLFKGKSPEQWRALYRNTEVDWGPDLGREVIEE